MRVIFETNNSRKSQNWMQKIPPGNRFKTNKKQRIIILNLSLEKNSIIINHNRTVLKNKTTFSGFSWWYGSTTNFCDLLNWVIIQNCWTALNLYVWCPLVGSHASCGSMASSFHYQLLINVCLVQASCTGGFQRVICFVSCNKY